MSSAEAITELRDGRNGEAGKFSQTFAYFAAFVALGLTTGSLGPTLPGLAEQTRTGLGEAGFLFTARSLGYLLGSLLIGKLFDRVSGDRLMACMLVLMAMAMALVPYAPAFALLVAVLLALGAAEGALDVGGNALLVRAHGGRVGPYMSGLHFFFGVGALLSPIIVARTVLSGGVDVAQAYRVLALLLLPAAVWLMTLPRGRRRAAATGDAKAQANGRLVVLIALFFFLYVGAEVAFGGWIYTYAVTLGLGDEASAAYLTSAFWGSLTLGRLLAIPLAARFRPRTILLADLIGCLLSVSVILLRPGSTAMVWAGTLGTGLFMASIFPTTLTLAQRRMKITGGVTRWFVVGASAGAMTLPWLAGRLFAPAGPRSVMLVVIADLLGAVGVYVALMRSPAEQRGEKFSCKDSDGGATNRVDEAVGGKLTN